MGRPFYCAAFERRLADRGTKIMPFTLDDKPATNGTANLDAIGDLPPTEIPEPQQHAIDEAANKQDPDNPQETVSPGSVEIDALGIPWNPSEHSTGADGKGIKTAKGTWRKRRGIKGSASYLNTDAAKTRASTEEK